MKSIALLALITLLGVASAEFTTLATLSSGATAPTAFDAAGSLFVVGTADEDSGAGAFYAYKCVNDVCSVAVKFVADDATAGAKFGSSISTNGQLVAVGAPFDGTAGAVYFFDCDLTGSVPSCTQKNKMGASSPQNGEDFGTALHITDSASGNFGLFVSAPQYDDGNPDSGTGRIFTYLCADSTAACVQQQVFIPTDFSSTEVVGLYMDGLADGSWFTTTGENTAFHFECPTISTCSLKTGQPTRSGVVASAFYADSYVTAFPSLEFLYFDGCTEALGCFGVTNTEMPAAVKGLHFEVVNDELRLLVATTQNVYVCILGLFDTIDLFGCDTDNPVSSSNGAITGPVIAIDDIIYAASATDTSLKSAHCTGGTWGNVCLDTCDCTAPQTCDDDWAGDGSCQCLSPFAGVDCLDCDAGFYGSGVCTPCIDCEHGSCLDGGAGNGQCSCDSGWTHATSDPSTPCDTREGAFTVPNVYKQRPIIPTSPSKKPGTLAHDYRTCVASSAPCLDLKNGYLVHDTNDDKDLCCAGIGVINSVGDNYLHGCNLDIDGVYDFYYTGSGNPGETAYFECYEDPLEFTCVNENTLYEDSLTVVDLTNDGTQIYDTFPSALLVPGGPLNVAVVKNRETDEVKVMWIIPTTEVTKMFCDHTGVFDDDADTCIRDLCGKVQPNDFAVADIDENTDGASCYLRCYA